MPDSLFPTMYHQFLRPDQAWFEVGGGGGGGNTAIWLQKFILHCKCYSAITCKSGTAYFIRILNPLIE